MTPGSRSVPSGSIGSGGTRTPGWSRRDSLAGEDLSRRRRRRSTALPRSSPGLRAAWMRRFGRYFDIPSIAYGPTGANHHGIDEYVDLPSVLTVTKTLALFIAEWCG